jgi:hypothetical protein
MKPFRRSRDFDGRFALTTLQNPNLDVRSMAERMQDARRQAEAQVEAEMAARDAAKPLAPASEYEAVKPSEEPAAQTNPFAANPPTVPEVITPDTIDIDPVLPAIPLIADAVPVSEPAKPQLKKPKPSKSTRARRAKPSVRRRTVASYLPEPELSPLDRHRRKCAICKHRECEGIEEDFINWYGVDHIAKDYRLADHRSIYRHAHATGLMERRRMNIRFAAESLVEQANSVTPTGDTVLRAIRTCTRINDRGEWHEPPSHVIVSSGGRATGENLRSNAYPQPELSAPESAQNILPSHDDIEVLPVIDASIPPSRKFLIDNSRD